MEKKTDAIYEAYMGDMDKDFTRKVRERIHWICNHVQGSNVLDVGCSQGITSILLGRENKSVIGLDVEQRCIDFANESLKTESAVVQGKVLFKQEDFISFYILCQCQITSNPYQPAICEKLRAPKSSNLPQ